jgi:dTDP-4-dehydrorhamnose reductase
MGAETFVGDLADMAQVESLAEKFDPQIIINCAALADVDRCEREAALSYRANVILVKNLLAGFPGARFVHISTDYIFGEGPSAVAGKPAPMNVYGQHKLEAEGAVLAVSTHNLVIRTNTTFDHRDRHNIFLFVHGHLSAGRRVSCAIDQWSNPIGSFGSAGLILRLVEKKGEGVFHTGGRDYVSRYEFALMVAEFFGLDKDLIGPVRAAELGRSAARPSRGGLDCCETEKFLDLFMPTLADQFNWIAEEKRRGLA